ncbi:cobalamin biosynthesis protein [Spiractinospora alimapuensis]|nr:cobalamin biosynthesis protein [Spiractinospora alimapuensis]
MGLDAAVGDPRRGHPVAVYGHAVSRLEHAIYAPTRRRGVLFTLMATVPVVATAVVAQRVARDLPVATIALTAAATWAVVGGRTLHREAELMADALEDGDLERARARLPHLCGRDPATLDATGLARATVESVAENTSDAVVAPLFWGGLAGLPGLLGYRAVNTLDAMVGHRSSCYENFGWASARLDDLANHVPARLTATLATLASPAVGRTPSHVLRTWARDGDQHPSPNAGQCESAFAGALGVRLGGKNVYGERVEHRPELGDGPPPGVGDIRRAVRLARWVGVGAGAVAAAMAWAKGRRGGAGSPHPGRQSL